MLEIGCGTGRNLVKMARRYPQAQLFGLDVSNEMLTSARAAIARAALEPRVRVAQGDAASFDAARLFGRPRFERVMISYALSMIPPWREALAQAIDALAPGGSLHIVDFGDLRGIARSVPRWAEALARGVRCDAARGPAGRTGGAGAPRAAVAAKREGSCADTRFVPWSAARPAGLDIARLTRPLAPRAPSLAGEGAARRG